jgi:hypothetical protein
VNAGVMEWLSIGLAFVAVIVILRYASRPRCSACARRHEVPAGSGHTLEHPWAADHQPDGEWSAISWRADHLGALPGRPSDANHLI